MNPYKILIVEDSQLVSFHLKKVLESAGYQILATLKSGEEAIEIVQKEKPDLILMDIMLDGRIDGIETSLIINEINHIPIIYLTALHDQLTLDRAKPTFPYSFLNKPFAESELLSNVQISLHKHESDMLIKQSEEQLNAIIDLMQNALILLDENLKITFINKSAEKLLLKSLDQLKGIELYHGLDLYNYKTKVCLKSAIDLDMIRSGKGKYLNDEFVMIKYLESEIIVTNFLLSKLQLIKSKSSFMIMFSEATKELQKEQVAKEKEREKLRYLIEGQENERARISRELHDGLGQLLNVIKMKLSKSDGNKETVSLMEEAIKETSRISDNLSPSKLRDFPLKTCLEDLIGQYEGLGIKIAFHTNIESEEIDEQKFNVYRIVQEALQNTLKHADASHIDIQLYKDKGHCTLTIEDDGKGIEMAKKSNENRRGQGLTNISDRCKIMNADFEMESSEALGTLIRINFLCNG